MIACQQRIGSNWGWKAMWHAPHSFRVAGSDRVGRLPSSAMAWLPSNGARTAAAIARIAILISGCELRLGHGPLAIEVWPRLPPDARASSHSSAGIWPDHIPYRLLHGTWP